MKRKLITLITPLTLLGFKHQKTNFIRTENDKGRMLWQFVKIENDPGNTNLILKK